MKGKINLKFIHMADMHFDTPFIVLNSRNKLGEKRRLEQREYLKKIIDYIKQNNIEYLFIAGDLYDNEHIRKTTIEYINNLFKEIPNTKIYITPGNHDPYINGSMYKTFNWNDNVYIFSHKIERVENSDCDIYGFGFDDFYCKDSRISSINIKNKEKINILITHGTLNGSLAQAMLYNPLNKNEIESLGFDYIALGHIHKTNINVDKNQKIIYPGSTIAIGFDEPGEHGIIVGEISKNKLELQFMKIDNKEFKEMELDISDVNSEEELIEKMNSLELAENVFYKIILVGNKNFEVNKYNLLKYISKENIIKIKNETKLKIDLEEVSKQSNLKGLFVKEILNELENNNYDKKLLENALEIGLEVWDTK